MPGIADIGGTVIAVAVHIYEYITEEKYSADEIQVINSLRLAWREAFPVTKDNPTVIYPVELRFAGEDVPPTVASGSTKKPYVKLQDMGEITLNTFGSPQGVEDFADNVLAGHADTACQLLLNFLNQRRQLIVGRGKAWDPPAQFCHLLIAFCRVLPKVDLDNSNALLTLTKWLDFIGLVLRREVFQQGIRGTFLYSEAHPVLQQVLTSIWHLFEYMTKVVERIQKQRSSRDLLKQLTTAMKNTCHFAVEIAAFMIAAKPVPKHLTPDTIGNSKLGGLPGYGADVLDKHVVLLGRIVYSKLKPVDDKDFILTPVPQQDEKRLAADALVSEGLGEEQRGFLLMGGVFRAHGLPSLQENENAAAIYQVFRNPEDIQNYYKFCYFIERLTRLIPTVELAYMLSGDGGNILIYHILGDGLAAILKMVEHLIDAIEEAYKSLRGKVNDQFGIFKLKKDMKPEDNYWKQNANHLMDQIHKKFNNEISRITRTTTDIDKDFKKWRKDKPQQLKRVMLQCIAFVKEVNQVGGEIEKLAIGYQHSSDTLLGLEQQLTGALSKERPQLWVEDARVVEIRSTPSRPSQRRGVLEAPSQQFFTPPLSPLISHDAKQPIAGSNAVQSSPASSTNAITAKDKREKIQKLLALFLKPILNIVEENTQAIVQVEFLTRWEKKEGMMSYKYIWHEETGQLLDIEILDNNTVVEQFKKGIYFCRTKTDKPLDKTTQHEDKPYVCKLKALTLIDKIIQYKDKPILDPKALEAIAGIPNKDAWAVMLVGGAIQFLRKDERVDFRTFKQWRISVAGLCSLGYIQDPGFLDMLNKIDEITQFNRGAPSKKSTVEINSADVSSPEGVPQEEKESMVELSPLQRQISAIEDSFAAVTALVDERDCEGDFLQIAELISGLLQANEDLGISVKDHLMMIRADCCMFLGMLDAALTDYSEVLKHDSKHTSALYCKAKVLHSKYESDEIKDEKYLTGAKECLDQLLELNPQHEQAEVLYDIIHSLLSDPQQDIVGPSSLKR